MKSNIKQNQKGRRPLRLEAYEYAQPGAYFVTICTKDRACLFGEVVDGEMRLNHMGEIVAEEWRRTSDIRFEIGLDAFVVMPNHFHGILFIHGVRTDVGATAGRPCQDKGPQKERGDRRSPLRDDQPDARGPTPRSLGSLMAGFKSAVTRQINQSCGTPGVLVWQRNYYEHVIRSERTLYKIREYILGNPVQWDMDRENPMTQRRRASPPKDEPWRV